MENIWKTKDGRLIPIPELENEHLVNIIRMLDRNAERAAFNYVIRSSPLISMMGDMAQMAAEDAMMDLADEPTSVYGDIYNTLTDEAEKRGLTL